MKNQIFLVFILAVFALIVSCGSSKTSSPKVFYTNSTFVKLLPTQSISKSLNMRQHVIGNFYNANGNKSIEADVLVVANDSLVRLYIMGQLGLSIGEILYAKDTVHFESSVIDTDKLKAEYVLADFQFCFYDKTELKKNFEMNKFSFVEEAHENYFERTLLQNNKVILVAKKDGDKIELKNYVRNYSYTILLENL